MSVRRRVRVCLAELTAHVARPATVIALGLSSVLAGCRRPEPKPDAGPITLTWLISTEPQRPETEAIVADFERANPDVHVDVRWTPEPQYQTKLKTLIAAGQSPDLFWCGDVWVAYLRPFLYDLTPLVVQQLEADSVVAPAPAASQ